MQLIIPDEVLSLAFSADDPIEPAHVRPARIEAAQLRYIRPAFGDGMYRSMEQERYDTFVDQYIKPALAHFVRYELIAELAVRAGDSGVVRPSSEESRQSTTATKSDTTNRTDNSTTEQLRMTTGEKKTAGTTSRKTTDKSTLGVVSDDVFLREGSDQRTVSVTDTSRTTQLVTSSEQNDTVASMTILEKNVTDQLNGTKSTRDDTIVKQEDARNINRTDTKSATIDVTGTDSSTVTSTGEQNDMATKSGTVASTGKSENSGTGTTSRSTLRAATAEEWQLLSRQALRDARTFLRYAVEYVEANRSQFPDYAPSSGLGSSSARRCIGGIIL